MSVMTTTQTYVETITHSGIYVTDGTNLYFVESSFDDFPLSPFDEYHSVKFFVGGNSPIRYDEHFDTVGDLNEYLNTMKAYGDDFYYKPLYVLDHGSVHVSTSSFNDRWDGWCTGVALITRKEIKSLYGNDIGWQEKASALIDDFVKEYEKYLNDDFYAHTLYKYNPKEKQWNVEETVNQCWSDDDQSMFDDFFNKENYRIIDETEVQEYL